MNLESGIPLACSDGGSHCAVDVVGYSGLAVFVLQQRWLREADFDRHAELRRKGAA